MRVCFIVNLPVTMLYLIIYNSIYARFIHFNVVVDCDFYVYKNMIKLPMSSGFFVTMRTTVLPVSSGLRYSSCCFDALVISCEINLPFNRY